MSEKNTKNLIEFTLDPKNPPKLSKSALDRLHKISDSEIEKAAATDKDNPVLTKEQLSRMRHATDVKALRKKLHMNQHQFAESFHLPLGNIRDWEQGRYLPNQAARNLLKVIGFDPDFVIKALKAS